MTTSALHRFLISLGSNRPDSHYIDYAVAELRQAFSITRESELMYTEPVDFPYPSSNFWNLILWGETALTKNELLSLLNQLEAHAGRDRSKPHDVPLDADLIIWDEETLKPRDLERPYLRNLL